MRASGGAMPDNRPVPEDACRTLSWPDGSVYRITRLSADTGDELLEMQWEPPPNGRAIEPHVHPRLRRHTRFGPPSAVIDRPRIASLG
jgi:hypothetical protein